MRISKPKGQTADYKLYDTIALRDADKANLINGQEVKVLNASGDPAIKSGWAIYKYDKESDLFDLLEKQESDLADYKLYADIDERSVDAINLKDGQEVKVLDASGDPAIKSGWAVYKYSKTSHAFDLIGKQEKDLQIGADEITVISRLANTNAFNSPELQSPYQENIRIMQDFDVTAEVDNATKKILLKINGSLTDAVTIPLRTPSGIKYIQMKGVSLSQGVFDASLRGKPVWFGISGYIRDTAEETISSMQYAMFDDGSPIKNTPRDVVKYQVIPLFQVRFDFPRRSTWAWNNNMLTLVKHWKRILAPAEERIVIPEPTAPEAVEIDNYTIEKNGDVLTVPASLNPIRHNYTIRKNFQLDLNFDNREFIRVTPRGADENGFLQIPIEMSSTGAIATLQLGTVDLPVSAFTGSPEMIHFGIMAKVEGDQAPKVACEYIVEADGSPIKLQPKQTDQKICIAQIRAKKPINTNGWREEYVAMWRYWETALLETFSETPVDGYGAEYIEKNGIKQITSIGAMTPTYYNLRYLQDFDFDFKISYNKTNNALNFVGIPIGGDRTIKITRAIGDGNIDGIVLPKETLFGSIKAFSGTTNNPEKGKYLYLHLGTNMNKIEAIQNVNIVISAIPKIKPQNNYMVTYGVFKVYIPKDGEQFDYGKVYLYRYWKNALATFDELMQDYKERNP